MNALLCRLSLSAAAAAVLVALPVRADAKPCVPLITDPSGDAQDYYLPGTPDRPDLDILAADMASTSTSLTIHVHVGSTTRPLAQGDNYYVFFHRGEATYNASAYRGPDGDAFRLQSARSDDPTGITPQQVDVSGKFDNQSGWMEIDVPVNLLGAPKSGARLYDISVVTGETYGTTEAGAGSTIDDTTHARTYKLGTHGCTT